MTQPHVTTDDNASTRSDGVKVQVDLDAYLDMERENRLLKDKLRETEDALIELGDLLDQAQSKVLRYSGVVECVLFAARANRYVPASFTKLIQTCLKEAGLR